MALQLYYFPIRGRSDAIRLLLEDTNTQYEHHEVSNWGERKGEANNFPLGQMPVIHHNGLVLGQSNAILRYIGKISNRLGANDREAALQDMMNDQCEDFRSAYTRVIYGDYDATVAKFIENVPNQLRHFENFLQNHHCEYFGGRNFGYADASLMSIVDPINAKMAPNCLHQFPLLTAWHQRCCQRPGVQAYLAKRHPNERTNGNGKF